MREEEEEMEDLFLQLLSSHFAVIHYGEWGSRYSQRKLIEDPYVMIHYDDEEVLKEEEDREVSVLVASFLLLCYDLL